MNRPQPNPDKFEPKYRQIYFDEETGGVVLIHEEHSRQDIQSEQFIAQAFAKQGKQVRLLQEIGLPEGVKTPDAEIEGVLWDFKRLTEDATSLANRVQAGIKQAIKQSAVNVGYHIDRSEYDLSEIERGIKRALDLDTAKQIDRVVLIFRDGSMDIYDRTRFES
jgi:hypothetical protein